jgi:hypothetical protein
MRKALSFATAASLGTASLAHAAPVTDWHTFRATTATTISGETTEDPIVGTTAATATNAVVLGYFTPARSLTTVGDKLTLTFTVGFNDASGVVATTPDQFRFALFDSNGETLVTTVNNTGASAGTTDTDTYRGYALGVKSGATGQQGSIRKRPGTGTEPNVFVGTSYDGTFTTTAGGTSVTYAGQVNGTGTLVPYVGVLTLELMAGGLQVSGSFTGNGGANSFSKLDTTPITTNFNTVGFLNGNSLSADQLLFQDVDVTFTPAPEPAAAALTGVGMMTFAARRRRRA